MKKQKDISILIRQLKIRIYLTMSSPISGVMLILLRLILRALDVEVPPRPSDLQVHSVVCLRTNLQTRVFSHLQNEFWQSKETAIKFYINNVRKRIKISRHSLMPNHKKTNQPIWRTFLLQTLLFLRCWSTRIIKCCIWLANRWDWRFHVFYRAWNILTKNMKKAYSSIWSMLLATTARTSCYGILSCSYRLGKEERSAKKQVMNNTCINICWLLQTVSWPKHKEWFKM